MGDDYSPQQLIFHHMLLHSQHILHHTITPLFSRPSCQPSPPNSHLPYLTQHTHLTPAMYLSILRSHLHRTSIILLVNVHVSAPYSTAELTLQLLHIPFPSLSLMLWFTNKLAISRLLLHAAVTLAPTALSTPASQ